MQEGTDDLTGLTGRDFGPVEVSVEAARAAAFVAATGDDPERWMQAAPPGFAAALLFAVAPRFLADERVLPFTRVLIHSEQHFTWHRPFRIGDVLRVGGRVDQVRERRGLHWVTFAAAAAAADGGRVLDSTSVFLMGRDAGREVTAERHEPGPGERGRSEPPHPIVLPAPGSEIEPFVKSASRSDLIAYAAATGDFNPIHQDHGAAVDAGLPGIVVHGLLTMAWVGQCVSRWIPGPVPVRSMQTRFRSPLFPGEEAVIAGAVSADGAVEYSVTSPAGIVAAGRAEPGR